MSAPSLRHVWYTPTDNTSEFDVQVARYLKAFQGGLRRKPTHLQKSLMVTAARAQAHYDMAMRHPDHYKPVDLAHLARCARQSANAMLASFPPRPRPGDALSRYLAGASA
jgi:hypothetical protein